MVQSNVANAVATDYGLLTEYDKLKKTLSIVYGLESTTIKRVAVGENEVFVLREGKNSRLMTVDLNEKSIKPYGGSIHAVSEIGRA